MRLGISSNFNVTGADNWAKSMKELGVKSCVFPLDSSAPAELVDEYVKAAKENDIVIAEVGIWRNAIATDEKEAKANLDYSIKQLALADRIGARCCVNVAGSCGAVWDGGYKGNYSKEMWDKTVKMVQTVIDEVKPKNTFYTLEPMPWMVPSSPEEYLRLIEDVARDEFAAHMDIINMINCPDRYFFPEDFMDKTFSLLGKYIRSCHLKDIKLEGYTFALREVKCGVGDFNLEHYAKVINELDPEMPIIIEHLTSDEEYRESFAYITDRLGKFIV